MDLPFDLESYQTAVSLWPSSGKHIIGTFTEDCIIVYQAYNPGIANWVVQNQTFEGCPSYSTERMTWIKPNFLWMMYRSGWGTKANQERILAISIATDRFTHLLKLCKKRDTDKNFYEESGGDLSGNHNCNNDVRIQWDPDHDPFGEKVERKAIQLGIRGQTLSRLIERSGKWIRSITDVTEFVQSQHLHVQNNELDLLRIPMQRVYDLEDGRLRDYILSL